MDKLRSGALATVYLIAFLYILTSVLAGIVIFGQGRYECAQKVGIIKGIFIGCDVIEGRFGPMNPPKFATSMLKGLIWPYYLFFSDDTNAEATEVPLQQIAQQYVDGFNANTGSRVDEYTTFSKAELQDNKVVINYLIKDNFYKLVLGTESFFIKTIAESGCTDAGSPSDKLMLRLIEGGYHFEINYINSQGTIQVAITSCPP